MGVVADAEGDIIIVDRVGDEPVEAGVGFSFFLGGTESSVGDAVVPVWNGETDGHAVGFVAEVVFIGPPDTGSQSFAGDCDPPFLIGVSAPSEATIPGRSFCDGRFSVVMDFEFGFGVFYNCRGEVDKDCVGYSFIREGLTFEDDAVYGHVGEEVNLESFEVVDCGEVDFVVPGDGFFDGVYFEVEVVEGYVVAGSFGSEHSSEGVGLGEGFIVEKVGLGANVG